MLCTELFTVLLYYSTHFPQVIDVQDDIIIMLLYQMDATVIPTDEKTPNTFVLSRFLLGPAEKQHYHTEKSSLPDHIII